MQFKKPVKASEWAQRKKEKEAAAPDEDDVLSPDLAVNLRRLRQLFAGGTDVIFREFIIGMEPRLPAAIVTIDGLTERRTLDVDIIHALMHPYNVHKIEASSSEALAAEILHEVLIVAEATTSEKWEDAVNAILSGDALLLLEGSSKGIICNARGWPMRSISPPETEAVIRGPHDSFNETLRENTALIRRRVRDPGLVFEMFKVGKRSRTDVALGYIRGIINPALVDEMRRRLQGIDIDGILDSGYLENIIQDSSLSPFPQLQHTERPDKAAANLFEGRLVIIVDGSPYVLIAPAVFSQFFQSPEDYYEKAYIGSALRLLRFASLFISLMLPGIYVALTAFHPEMFPTTLALAVASSRASVPFSAFLEVVIMEFAIEILREASTRLPGLIGPTIGIVGAIVLGDAAVKAGIASPLTIIIIAITSIASYSSPAYSIAVSIRLLRFAITVAAGVLGLYGIVVGIIFIAMHLAATESLGVPYLAPIAPFYWSDQKDVLLRFPVWSMARRPSFLRPEDRRRMQHQSTQEGNTDE